VNIVNSETLQAFADKKHKPRDLTNTCQSAQDLPWQSLRHEVTRMLASDSADGWILDLLTKDTAESKQT